MASPRDEEIAALKSANAALAQALAARTAELAKCSSEYGEALEQQAATAEVLQVINQSAGDLSAVFDAMLERAMRLCQAAFGSLYTYDRESFQSAAQRGVPPAYAAFRAQNPPRPLPGSIFAQNIATRRAFQIVDMMATGLFLAGDPQIRAMVELGGIRTIVSVPLFKDATLLGLLTVFRQEVRAFSARQIALLEGFAAQAVIAMENARLLDELRQRTAELQEALDHQTATNDVLRVISRSVFDLSAVLRAVISSAVDLCRAERAILYRYRDGRSHFEVGYNNQAEYEEHEREAPIAAGRETLVGRVMLEGSVVQIVDAWSDPEYGPKDEARLNNVHAMLGVPLLRDGELIGVFGLARTTAEPYTERQIELVTTFAAQAVIAMENARLLTELRQRTEELARRNSEYGERIEQQAATIDVLKAMSASPGDAQPVFRLIVERARAFCEGESATLALLRDDMLHLQTFSGTPGTFTRDYEAQFPRPVDRTTMFGRAILARDVVQTPDLSVDPDHQASMKSTGTRAIIAVPLLRAGVPIGAIALGKERPGEFSATQVQLLRTFAEQAVIAIGGAETYRELQESTAALARRNSEYGERIEHQSATIDVLKAMSASPDDTHPVFDLITHRAQELCNSKAAGVFEYDGDLVHIRSISTFGEIKGSAEYTAAFPMKPTRGSIPSRAILDKRVVHIRDMSAEQKLLPVVQSLGIKSCLGVPLLRDDTAIGAFVINSEEVGGFTDSQVALVQTFAEQAVIAITSVANFRALRERTAELTRSVAELQALEEVLRAVNSSLELDTVLSTIISRAVQLSDADEGTVYEFDSAEQVFVPKSAYGMTKKRVAALRDRRIRIGETPLGNSAAMRAPLHIPDLTQTLDIDGTRELVQDGIHALLAVPLLRDEKVLGGLVIRRRAVGGFAPTVPTLLQTFAGQCVLAIENARLFQEARQARVQAETTLADLRRTQDRLVQSEKMASLGQLTAGIAHEIKNPLNFVNNFSDLSIDLLDELHDAVAPDRLAVADDLRSEIDALTATLKGNLEKIAEHGRRADSIVTNMLLHSRSGPGEHRPVDLNATVEEALNLAFHGARAATPGFNIAIEKQLDPRVGTVDLYPQEITRVMLNLIGNGFYAANERANAAGNQGFAPTLRLITRDLGDQVEIRVRDNGIGISETVRDRIFEPFFTTKPAGEGTGLGLSLSYEIVVQQHGGRLTVDSRPDAFTEFVIILPRTMAAAGGVHA